jgi:ParB family chromosome partitioning protein
LWDWIISLNRCLPPKRLRRSDRLFRKAHCERRIAQAARLACAVSLDVVEAGWRRTVENYLGRVPKVRILEAVREARGEQSAQLIDHLKKADMAKEAERLLEGTGWLPEPLRTMSTVTRPAVQSDDSEALPDFLTGDGDESVADGEGANRRAIAAE